MRKSQANEGQLRAEIESLPGLTLQEPESYAVVPDAHLERSLPF